MRISLELSSISEWTHSRCETIFGPHSNIYNCRLFQTDFGERIPHAAVKYHDGSDPYRMHNAYTQIYNKLVFELLQERFGKNEAVLFARSATAGGQRFPVVRSFRSFFSVIGTDRLNSIGEVIANLHGRPCPRP